MATSYEAVVRLAPVNAAPEREEGLLTLIGANLPDEVKVTTERDSAGLLLITMRMIILAADTSDVQLKAQGVAIEALTRAGLSEQAALLNDIDVRSSS